MLKRTLLLIFSSYLFLSCNLSLDTINTPASMTGKIFYAQIQEEDQTKTFIDSDYNMYWHKEDRISVFRSGVNECYQFAGESGEYRNEFHKADMAATGDLYSRNYAVFPYNAKNGSSGEGVFSVILPHVQKYAKNSFGPEANSMIAVTADSEDDIFYFKNICGFLKLKLYGNSVIRSIIIKGNSAEKISGPALVTIQYGQSPSLKMNEGSLNEICLDCGESGVSIGKTIEDATEFWIVIPPITFADGFTCEINGTGDATISKKVTKSETITRNKVKSMAALKVDFDSNDLLSFSLSDETATYDAFDIRDGFVDIQVPGSTDYSHLKACFSHNGYCVSVNGVEQISGQSIQDFSDCSTAIQYVVSSISGKQNIYTIRLFDLPVVFVETPNHEAVTSKNDWMEGATIKIIKEDGTFDLNTTMSIKGRGNISWVFPKKPYAIKLDSKEKVLGMKKHKRWCLLANWRDRTLLRNDLAFYLASKAEALEWTPSGKFVEMFFNGKYVGNYYLCEQIKIDKNRINITEISKEDIEGEALSGGYLLEYDNGFDELNKFKSLIKNYPVNIKFPDEEGFDVQVGYITDYINNLENILYDNERLLNHEYEAYLDVNSFIDWWLILELTAIHEPANPRSCYMYKGRDGVDSPAGTICPLKAGPVWDFDMWSFMPTRVNQFYTKGTLYYNALFKDPKFVATAKQRWNELKPKLNDFSDYIDQVAAFTRRSNERNIEMWPIVGHPTKNGDEDLSFDESINRVKSSLSDRIQWLDNAINKL